MEWKESSSLHKLYIQGKKEQIYDTDLALPEFFLDQGKAISQLANTRFRKVKYNLKEAEESYVQMRRDVWTSSQTVDKRKKGLEIEKIAVVNSVKKWFCLNFCPLLFIVGFFFF